MTLAEVAAATGAVIAPGGSPAKVVTGVAPLARATATEVAFLEKAAMRAVFDRSGAGAVFVPPGLAGSLDPARNLLVADDPRRAHAVLARLLHPESAPAAGLGPGAVVDPAARLGAGVAVGPGAVISAGAVVGAGSAIGACTFIGEGVTIGAGARIGPHVTLTHALVGERVTILPGARIGQPGFGFLPGPAGLVAVPQLGRVVIGDDVEIGANATIDRGTGEDTVIGAGTKIDNLVQIGHNCRVGRHCVLCGHVALAGSVTLGDQVMLGGKVGVADNIEIGDRAKVAASAGVVSDLPAGGVYMGAPAGPASEWRRILVGMRRFAKRGSALDH